MAENIATARRWAYVYLLVLMITGTGPAYAQRLTYNGSLQYATGSYFFTERTGSFYFSNGFTLSGDRLSFSVSIPFVAQNTPWVSSTALGTLPTGGPASSGVGNSTGRGKRGGHRIDPGTTDTVSYMKSSFGDPTANGSIRIFGSRNGGSIINGNVGIKFPLTDPTEGFGTGEWDASTGVSLLQRFGRKLLYMDLTYWYLGDMEGLDFQNPLSYSVSLGSPVGNGKLMVMANFYGYTTILRDVEPPISTGTTVRFSITSQLSLNGNLLFGLTESASDFSAGAGLSFAFK